MKQRIVTGLIGGAAFLSLLWLGGLWFFLMTALLSSVSYWEYSRMRKSCGQVPVGMIGNLFLLFLLSLGFWHISMPIHYPLWIFVFLLLLFPIFSKNRFTIEDAAYQLFGAIYIGLGFYHMILVRIDYGLESLLLAILSVWATDTGAYFGGRLWGKNKLSPSISPNKTIEGALSGTVLSIIVAILFFLFGTSISQLYDAILIGFVISCIGQLGDLIESAIKRHFNVKDSGQILPGHGGMFDRFDSMIAVFPIFYFLVEWL